MNDTWFKAIRSEEAQTLRLRNPLAYVLAAVIADRTQRTDRFNRYDLRPGEAFLGDFTSYGMTRQQYRTAMAQLEEWGFATFRSTNKGTIAKLTSTRLFDPNVENSNQRPTNEKPSKSASDLILQPPPQPPEQPTNGKRNGSAINGLQLEIHGEQPTEQPTAQPTPNQRLTIHATTTKNVKNGKNGLFTTPAQGGSVKVSAKKKEAKYPPEVHERAIELYESWKDCWAMDMDGIAIDLDFQRDARALHTLASLSGADGSLLPVTDIMAVARWAWGEHRRSLTAGRSDFVLEQSLCPVRFAPRFADLQVRRQSGFSDARLSREAATLKNAAGKNVTQQGISRRISLDKFLTEAEDRLRELNESLALASDPQDRPADKAERELLKRQISEAKEERRKLTVG